MKNNLFVLLFLLPVGLTAQQMTHPLVAQENWLLLNPAALPGPLHVSGDQKTNYIQASFYSAYYKSPDDPKHIGFVYLFSPNWRWLNVKSTNRKNGKPHGFVFGVQGTHTSIAGSAENNLAVIGIKYLTDPLDEKKLLTLGISLGLRSVSENTDYLDFRQFNDPFDVGRYQAFSPHAGIGMYYNQHKAFFISASAQQVSGRFGLDALKNISVVPHFYLGGGIIAWKVVQPMFWLSKAQQVTGKRKASSPLSADFIGRFYFFEKNVWFDAGYGSAKGLRAGFGWKIKNYLLIGFAYDHARANIFGPQTELTTAGFW